MVKKKKMDAEAILRELAEMRRSIPFLNDVPARPADRASDGRMVMDGMPLETEEDFEYGAIADALQSLADDISAAVDQKRAFIEEQALEIYYKAEELARDPEHAELIPHVEKMRAAYLKDHGRPIPPRKKQ